MKKLIAIILVSTCLIAEECCGPDYFVTADFLYWFAKETDLSYALKAKGTSQISGISISPVILAPKKVEQFETAWDPGFRLGIGFMPDYESWDLYVNWTYFHNEKKNSTSVPSFGTSTLPFFPGLNQFALIDPWINVGNFTSTFDAPFLFDRVSAAWKLNLNILDLELGRKYDLNNCFAFRPYAGLRAAFLKLDFHNDASLTPNASESVTFKDHFENRFCGIGILGGIQPEWRFTPRFLLFSNLDAALVWGQSHAKKHENYLGTAGFGAFRIIDYKNSLKNHCSHLQAILDLSLGIRWEESWLCDRLCTALDLSWGGGL